MKWKSTGGFKQPELSPCRLKGEIALCPFMLALPLNASIHKIFIKKSSISPFIPLIVLQGPINLLGFAASKNKMFYSI